MYIIQLWQYLRESIIYPSTKKSAMELQALLQGKTGTKSNVIWHVSDHLHKSLLQNKLERI